jgi:hypothetical protein
MPRVKRTEICAADEVQAFHLINRCVRRTFLCGKDRRSGKDYSHWKEWIRQQLEERAGIFALDVLGFPEDVGKVDSEHKFCSMKRPLRPVWRTWI